MIQPNFDLLLWILLISFSITGVARIIAGAIKLEKNTRYGNGDVIAGLLEIFIILWVIFK